MKKSKPFSAGQVQHQRRQQQRRRNMPLSYSEVTNESRFSSVQDSEKNVTTSTEAELNSANENVKFREACEKIRKNIEKYVGDGLGEESSSSEDELDDTSILEKTLQKYQSSDADLYKTKEILQDSLTSGAVVCLICIESVKRNDPIWSCQSCYCMLHVSCIQKWAKDSMFYQSSNISDENPPEIKWCCPKCRNEYKRTNVPSSYYCFCQKVENPPFDPWNIPHSCGQTCGKKLKPFCGHECLLLCHPGPCPPCPKTVLTPCYCSKSKAISRRCGNKGWSCGNLCNKMLSCNQHFCEQPCHEGDCPPCHRQSEQSCLCGSSTKLRPCDDPTWQCNKVCDKPLSCGNHVCTTVCHSGPCSSCPKSGPRFCPCQKKISLLPCTEDIPPCGDTCEKLLTCELHRCSQRCHYGPCGECLQMRTMRCRCGQKEKSVPCCKEFICDIKCKRKRDCGKHNCNRKCCIGSCPPCEAPCGRTLNCGSHKCKSRCHAGPCFPCRETVDVTCNCKSTKITIPCGRRRTAIPPRCTMDCKIPPDCHHEKRHKHRCHFGTCPPCLLICKKVLSCGHTCPARCHSALLTKVENKKKKEGPWDLIDCYKMELVNKPCPPCVVPMPVTCLGGHVVHNFPCSEARPWSCGRPCNRKLLCGNHMCELECHDASDSQGNTQPSVKCQTCERPCSKERPEGCPHECKKPCHSEDCDPCKEIIKMKCHCQLNTKYIICNEWTSIDPETQIELLSCKNTCPKELPCGHRCPFTCHSGSCPQRIMCKKKVMLRCLCRRIKKEVLCNSLTADVKSLECDKECIKQIQLAKAAEEEAKEKLKAEEKRREALQMEEFLKKTEGRKKKRKKTKDVAEGEKSFLKQYSSAIFASVLTVIAAIYFLYLCKESNHLPEM